MAKNYIIVGASSGIGAQLAEQLVREGHHVLGLSRTASSAGEHEVYDVMTAGDIHSLPESIDGFIYCPGTISLKPFRSMRMEQFREEMEINFFGAVQTLKQCLKGLKKSENPSVVFFSTVAVQQGMPFHSSISSAKGALEGLTRSLAAEFAPKIRVNCIAPSLVDTPLASKILNSEERKEASAKRHPLKRVGEAKDIAAMCKFLLSEEATWITGQVISVDGGMSSVRV